MYLYVCMYARKYNGPFSTTGWNKLVMNGAMDAFCSLSSTVSRHAGARLSTLRSNFHAFVRSRVRTLNVSHGYIDIRRYVCVRERLRHRHARLVLSPTYIELNNNNVPHVIFICVRELVWFSLSLCYSFYIHTYT